MSRRAPETLVDWLVVGIAPFLIMLLVGSLVFYLVEVFYLGDYQARLLFVLGLFVMAVVCIARISMEEGVAYAAMYAAPLAFVVGLAVAAFVKVTGPLEALGPMLNWGLMILIWWSANKLTWDCTLIEEGRDFTGQGLMQTTGLDRFFRVQAPEPPKTEPQTAKLPDLAGTSSTDRPVQLPIWKWWKMNNDRPHAPGVWVVYFSIAALPLFGLGQWFIPASNLDLRRRAFWLLVVYVAAGLSLLMATSFLSLRRYLRQRNQEMPGEMAAVWLGTGTTIIFILLLLASLLPRPIPEYSITHLAPQIQSPDRKASRWGWGKEGAKKKDANSPQRATQGQVDPATKQTSSEGQPTPNAKGNTSQNGSSGSSGNNSGGQTNQTQSSVQQSSQTGNQQNSTQPDSSGQQNNSNNQNSQSNQGNQSLNNSGNSQSSTSSSPRNAQANNQSSSNSQQSQSNPQQQNANNSSPPPSSPPTESQSTPPLPNEVQVTQTNYLAQAWGQVFAWLTHALKWLFYLLVIGVIAYYAWQHREWLIAAWQQLMKELRELWARWFGQKQPAAVAAAPAAPPPPPKRFAEYADPFASGLAARWTLAELVRYTFEALEARGREQNCPRGSEQTPLEYAAAVGQVEPDLASDFRSLADLYGQLAFAGGAASPQSTSLLQQLWQRWR